MGSCLSTSQARRPGVEETLAPPHMRTEKEAVPQRFPAAHKEELTSDISTINGYQKLEGDKDSTKVTDENVDADAAVSRRQTARNYRQSLMDRELSSTRPDIFRTVSPTQLLAGFGLIFESPEPGCVFPGAVERNSAIYSSMSSRASKVSDSVSHQASQGDAMEGGINDDFVDSDDEDREQHRTSDAMFKKAEKSTKADCFVSHVWSAPRWQKTLALSYYFNVRCATISAVLTWLCIVVALVVRFGVDQMGGKTLLLPYLVYVPMAVFSVTFFFGHRLFSGREVWLDKLCIHQSRGTLKKLGVTALPEIVANSDRLCILWCDEYFERLWCNAEVATFCAINDGANKVDLQPLWLAPWVLATLVCDLISISIADRLFELIPIFGDFFFEQLPNHPTLAVFLMQVAGIGTAFWVSYMPATIPNWISFSTKLHNHMCMMKQTEEYSLQEAKCTVESDRAVVVNQIEQLFNAVPKLGQDPDAMEHRVALARFDYFIRHDLKREIANRVGVDDSLNYPLALLVFLPMLFDSIANILGCDGMPCDAASKSEGYDSVRQYMLTNSLCWTVGCFFIYPTTYPVMLGLIKRLTSCFAGWRRNVVGVLCAISAYFYMSFCEGIIAGLVLNAVVTENWYWKVALAVVMIGLLVWNRLLFKLLTAPLVIFYGCFLASVLWLSRFG